MSTTTPNLGLTLPTPNVDTGWGSTLNTDLTTIDNLFAAAGTGTSVGLQVGSGKTLVLSGTMILGSGDNSGTTAAPTIRGPAKTGTNAAGVNITLDAANGTGTGGSGDWLFRTAPAGAAGTVANTMQTTLAIRKDRSVDIYGALGVGSSPSYGTAGQALVSGGTGAAPSWASIAGRLLRAPQLLTSGTSYTTPANCTAIYVEVVGAGGGGGAAQTASTTADAAGGGGSGGYCAKYFTVTGSTAYTYAIGAAGAAGTAGADGGTGGTTTFTVGAVTLSATGGTGGTSPASSANATLGWGGSGGTATGGDINVSGTSGQYGAAISTSFVAAGGGAPSVFGGGGSAGNFTAGGDGGYGAGGGGAASASGPDYSGGAGGQGVIRVWEFA